jgi:LPXTG-motif cell wall-anchored protein
MAIPDYRLEPTGKTVVRFSESGGGPGVSGSLPENGIPIKEWFYPGDNAGAEFRVMPQPQVAAAEPPPAAAPEPAPAPAAPAAAQPSPPAAQPAEPTAPAAQPEPEPQPQPQAQNPASSPEQNQLPQTASQMPMVAIIGFVALAIAGALRILARRSV